MPLWSNLSHTDIPCWGYQNGTLQHVGTLCAVNLFLNNSCFIRTLIQCSLWSNLSHTDIPCWGYRNGTLQHVGTLYAVNSFLNNSCFIRTLIQCSLWSNLSHTDIPCWGYRNGTLQHVGTLYAVNSFLHNSCFIRTLIQCLCGRICHIPIFVLRVPKWYPSTRWDLMVPFNRLVEFVTYRPYTQSDLNSFLNNSCFIRTLIQCSLWSNLSHTDIPCWGYRNGTLQHVGDLIRSKLVS